MENDSTVYVGLDVHKDSIAVAYALGMGEVEQSGRIGTTRADIDPVVQTSAVQRATRARGLRGRSMRLCALSGTGSERIRLHGVRAVVDSEEAR
jgi:hypothetical protein